MICIVICYIYIYCIYDTISDYNDHDIDIYDDMYVYVKGNYL